MAEGDGDDGGEFVGRAVEDEERIAVEWRSDSGELWRMEGGDRGLGEREVGGCAEEEGGGECGVKSGEEGKGVCVI